EGADARRLGPGYVGGRYDGLADLVQEVAVGLGERLRRPLGVRRAPAQDRVGGDEGAPQEERDPAHGLPAAQVAGAPAHRSPLLMASTAKFAALAVIAM